MLVLIPYTASSYFGIALISSFICMLYLFHKLQAYFRFFEKISLFESYKCMNFLHCKIFYNTSLDVCSDQFTVCEGLTCLIHHFVARMMNARIVCPIYSKKKETKYTNNKRKTNKSNKVFWSNLENENLQIKIECDAR